MRVFDRIMGVIWAGWLALLAVSIWQHFPDYSVLLFLVAPIILVECFLGAA